MRQFVVATHAHLAAGLAEAASLLAGERDNVRVLNMFVDGELDVATAARRAIDETPAGDELVVCTDLLGGSVNNEFLKAVQERPQIRLVTNTNLPVLLQLVLADEDEPIDDVIRQIVAADESRPTFVNDALATSDVETDEEF